MHLDLMRDSSKELPKLGCENDIIRLRIWNCKYRTLKPISDFHNLEELVVASFPDTSFAILATLSKLHYLSILHMPKVTELDALSELSNIESLSLATSPSWDAAGKCTIVRSLAPLARMKSLKHLELMGICPVDKSLAALEACSNLQTAKFSQYPKDEVERFYRVTDVLNKFNPESTFSNCEE